MRIVNFRNLDHIDRAMAVSQLPLDSHKLDANKANEANQWYNNSLFNWVKRNYFNCYLITNAIVRI
jgi:hypothetical protein